MASVKAAGAGDAKGGGAAAASRDGKAAAGPFERPGLSKDEVAELKEAFDLFDTDGTRDLLPTPRLPSTVPVCVLTTDGLGCAVRAVLGSC
jgi:hypothetical protein